MASSDKVLEANIEFHREQAATYDETHRFRPVAQWAFEHYVGSDDRVLDLGTGTGAVADVVASVDVVGVDLSREMLFEGRGGIQARAAELPFRDDAFDAVTARSVLHHLPDLEVTLDEMQRVLRPGGRLVVANEPVGDPVRTTIKRLRGRLGHALGRSNGGWKADLADEMGTNPVGLTELVNIWEGTGVPVATLDGRFDREYYLEYLPEDTSTGRYMFVGVAP